MKLPHPAASYQTGQDLIAACQPHDLVYFLLNVGNADTQLLCLPEDEDGVRDMVVVDVGRVAGGKLPQLIEDLIAESGGPGRPLLTPESRVRLLVATHPHEDHVGGVPHFLRRLGHLLEDGGEIWDPAFFHRTGVWFEMMAWLEDHPRVGRLHPTAGTRRHIGGVGITALSPSIRLRNNFDTFGVDINNSSIALQIEFPIKRVFAPDPDDADIGRPPPEIGRQPRVPLTRSLLLGADAQTTSWANVEVDFPTRQTANAAEYRMLGLARGAEPLGSLVFKVPHHCSKNGLNLELVGRVKPKLSLISCRATDTSHTFPHLVALELLREALDPRVTKGGVRGADPTLGIHTTADTVHTGDPEDAPLGSIAVVMPPDTAKPSVWRLGDTPDAAIPRANLRAASLYI